MRAGTSSLPLHGHPQLCVALGSEPGPLWQGLLGEGVGKRENLLEAISSPPCVKLSDYLSSPALWVLVVGRGRRERPGRGAVALVMWVLGWRSAHCACRSGELCNTQKGCECAMPMKTGRSSGVQFAPQWQGWTWLVSVAGCELAGVLPCLGYLLGLQMPVQLGL